MTDFGFIAGTVSAVESLSVAASDALNSADAFCNGAAELAPSLSTPYKSQH